MLKLLFLALSLAPQLAIGSSACIFSSSTEVKCQKDNFNINGKVKFLSGTVDPSSSATTGSPGFLYFNTTSGTIYRKTDSGSSTNWAILGNGQTVDGTTIEDVGGLRVKDLGISAGKLASDAVTTAKILDANVTRAKLAALGQQVSTSSGTPGTTTSACTTYADITNLSVTITTTGRPVFVGVQSSSGSDPARLSGAGADGSFSQTFRIIRDATPIALARLLVDISSGNVQGVGIPPGALWKYDVVAAGTYTYKVQACTSDTNARVEYAELIAFET